jgi:hypothetical protein
MARIRVNPDLLSTLGHRFQQTAMELRSLEARIAGAYTRLDWEGPDVAVLDEPVRQARAQAHGLADQADVFARQLTVKAQEFEVADAAGVSALTELANGWLAWQAAYKPFGFGEDADQEPAESPAVLQATIDVPPAEEDDGTGGKLRTLEADRVADPPRNP